MGLPAKKLFPTNKAKLSNDKTEDLYPLLFKKGKLGDTIPNNHKDNNRKNPQSKPNIHREYHVTLLTNTHIM